MVNDFLFELGCEELPSGAVWSLAEALVLSVKAALEKAGINYQSIKPFAAPRRLAFLLEGVDGEQPVQQVTRRGPAVIAAFDAQGKPTPALLGFCKSCSVDVNQLTRQQTDKGEWLVYENRVAGVKTTDLLPSIITQAVNSLPIAKPMRWGSGDAEFARPVHWLVMLWNDEVIPCELLGVTSGRISYGHRFHHPKPVTINHPRDYETSLEKAQVIADFAKRRQTICQQVNALAEQSAASAIMPETLIDEVTSIVEWPQALKAGFRAHFLEVPSEALIASMQSHQKCFALQDKTGQLLPYFITVSNLQSKNAAQVIAGNEKVMHARLSDAEFFFEQDKKDPLSHHIAATAKVVFQAKLGTLLDKAMRVSELMSTLTEPLKLDLKQAQRSAELSKCDLMTGMVGEFPELQGLMGYYYARHDKEDEAVAIALNEQYLPRFAADVLPVSNLGLALSLADRLDTLVGIFMIGQKPTGVKDPFKLRRHALAVLRLLISTPAKINLQHMLTQTFAHYKGLLNPAQATIDEINDFIMDRLQAYYQSQGISSDIVLAVRSCQQSWLYDFDRRIKALAVFVKRPEAIVLSAACKRVNNLLQQEAIAAETLNDALLTESAEIALFTHMNVVKQQLTAACEQGDYGSILDDLASLREPVDAFFDKVMVMVDDPLIKHNRLALLARLQSMLQSVADISVLQLNA